MNPMTPRTAKEWAEAYLGPNATLHDDGILEQAFEQAMTQAREPLEKELAELKEENARLWLAVSSAPEEATKGIAAP